MNCVHDSIILLRAVLSPNLSQVKWSQLLSTHHILVSLFASANEHHFILYSKIINCVLRILRINLDSSFHRFGRIILIIYNHSNSFIFNNITGNSFHSMARPRQEFDTEKK